MSTVIHEVWILGKAAWNHWNFSLRFVRIIVLILSVIQQKINFRNINYKREDDFLLSAVILQTIFFFPNPSEKQIQHPCQGGLKKENCTISHQIEKVLYKSSIGIFTTCFHSLSRPNSQNSTRTEEYWTLDPSLQGRQCSMTRPISCHRRPRIDNPSSAVGISCSYQ